MDSADNFVLHKYRYSMERAINRTLEKMLNSVFIVSLRQSFISLLPFLIGMASVRLLLQALNAFNTIEPGTPIYEWLTTAQYMISLPLPLVTVIAISYFICRNIGCSRLSGIVLAVVTFLMTSNYLVSVGDSFKVNVSGSSIYSIFVPIVSSYLLHFFSHKSIFNNKDTNIVSVFLIKHINLIFPFLLTFSLLYTFIPLISFDIRSAIELLNINPSNFSTMGQLIFLQISASILWMFGVHGANVMMSIMDVSFLHQEILPNLTVDAYISNFADIGGIGCMWGFIIAAYFFSSHSHLRKVVKLSLPFQTFNLAEICLYGVPLIFNPYFIVPFLLCPLINILISYHVLATGLIPIVNTETSWMTPIVINSYFISGGSLITVGFQLLLLALDTAIYIPFVRMYAKASDTRIMFGQLSAALATASHIEEQSERQYISETRKQQKSYKKIKKIVDDISKGELLLYYQPKMDTQDRCYGFESLLRLRQANGNIVGPYFLSGLKKARFLDAIDHWVITQAETDLRRWKKQGFEPNISINLNPFLLRDKETISGLIEKFEPYYGQVEIEILESSYTKSPKAVQNNIEKLKEHGISTAIDDFGTGYSSLSLLYQINAETIKLDKSTLDHTDTKKGAILYKQLCSMCKVLGFKLVAEGVETPQQVSFVREAGVDYLQGWHYAPALPANEALQFAFRNSMRDKIKSIGNSSMRNKFKIIGRN